MAGKRIYSVSIDDESAQILRDFGDGNLSAGIRRAAHERVSIGGVVSSGLRDKLAATLARVDSLLAVQSPDDQPNDARTYTPEQRRAIDAE